MLITFAGGFLCGIISVFNFLMSIVILLFFAAFGIYTVFFYAKEKSEALRYFFDEKYLTILRGVYFKKKIKIKLSKIQYIETTIAPDQKLFDMCSLIFYMTGAKVCIKHILTKDSKIFVGKLKYDTP
jgi:membrane protein YdbS with pleckstrin-like domain